MSSPIKAITFDLWDTLIDDDSDEPRRRELGLRSKLDERHHLLWQALRNNHPITMEEASAAWDMAEAAFTRVWKEDSITWTISERLAVALDDLAIDLTADEMANLVETLAGMELEVPPDPVPGAGEALAALSTRYRLCVVSDAIVTPGTGLRRLLEIHGLARHFDGFVFSDEIGHSKPHPAMFGEAARQLGVDLTEIVHVGDRDQNDVKGPQALGMKAILFTAARDNDKDNTTADALCGSHQSLPAIIDALAGHEPPQ